MNSSDKIIEELKYPVRKEINFREIETGVEKTLREYEKRVFTAPLIGCGAGLVLYSSALIKSGFPDILTPKLVCGLWCFLLGVVCSILAILLYVFHLSKKSEELIHRGNAQDFFLDIRDKVWGSGKEKKNKPMIRSDPSEIDISMFSPSVKQSISDIQKWNVKAQKLERCAKVMLQVSRILIVISAILFVAGVTLPLVSITFCIEFI